MSAGFDIDGEVFWGTNGAIEAYLEAMGRVARERFGLDDPLTRFLHDALVEFCPGYVLFLDEFLTSPDGRKRFLLVLDGATHALLRGDNFSEFGKNWVATVVSAFRERLVRLDA